MTDRDKLIELFNPFADGTYNSSGTIIDGTKVDDVVDSLLANGIIVPPCKVGDVVYVIEPCSCYTERYKEKCQNRCNDSRRKCLAIVPIKHKKYPRPAKCLKLFERDFRLEHLHRIGKTVFLTKEDAEEKLKELGK